MTDNAEPGETEQAGGTCSQAPEAAFTSLNPAAQGPRAKESPMTSKTTWAVALGCWAALTAAAEAQTRYREQAFDDLARYGQVLARDGFRSQGTWSGWLRNGETARGTIVLHAGTEYRVAGSCDNDCLDLDFELFTPAGYLADSDRDSDASPLVSHEPTWRDAVSYTIEVTMARCTR
jgi:hypothetical protein